jgi:hypothetical protein
MAFLAENKKSHIVFLIAACAIMLSIAFFQCYRTTHELQWAADPDFDRDISFARGAMEGNFGQDPNFKGAYLWYNPMLFSMEAVIARVSAVPLNIVAVRGGAYLNLLGPIFFFVMCLMLFGWDVALGALLSFLFLASGNILGWGAATYSPWLYPVCFAQFIFYTNILLSHKAFSSQKYFWFGLLGFSIGLNFLAHAAPTLLLILIMLFIQSQKIHKAAREKSYSLVKKFFLQGATTFAFFVIAASPLLYFVAGKYHLHQVNRVIFEYSEGIFLPSHFIEMAKANLNISFLISLIGFVWFYKKFHHQLTRKIIFSWLIFSIAMYMYSTLVAVADYKLKIHLPGTVPAFHYFFYLKALQSVFFGFGFVFLVNLLLAFFTGRIPKKIGGILLVAIVLICAFAYFPFYKNRKDFVLLRGQAITKQNETDKIEVYNYIVNNIPSDKVILCEWDQSLFPVMATARKMVSINPTFSNPYLDYNERENARNSMLQLLKTGLPTSAKQLFSKYEVSFALLSRKDLGEYKEMPEILGEQVFKNGMFVLFRVNN